MRTYEETIQTAKHYLTCRNPNVTKAIQLYQQAIDLTDDGSEKSAILNEINKLKRLNKIEPF